MSFDETEAMKNTDAQWLMNGDRPRHAPEVPPKVKLSLSEHIRREVAALLTAPSFKREMAQELMLLSSPENLDPSTEYVKLQDLKDIVSQLISRNVVGQSLKTLEENSRRFATALTNLEQKCMELSERVEQLERLQEVSTSDETERTNNDMKSVVSSPTRLIGGGVVPVPHPCCEESIEISHDQLYRLGTKPEKLRIYDDLICKYHNQLTFSETSTPCSSSTANTALVSPLTKSKACQMWDSPSPKDSMVECSQLQNDCARRAAERRQFETNMLMYRKSQFSMQLNNRIDNFTFTLWKKNQESNDYE